jgi:hypothetical protein
MKRCFIVLCSLLFCTIDFASDIPIQQEKNYQQSIDDTVTAFSKLPSDRKYKILAQLADELPDDDKKIKLGARILKEGLKDDELLDDAGELMLLNSLVTGC